MGKHCCKFVSGHEIKLFSSFLQLKDKERQMIKERFKVRKEVLNDVKIIPLFFGAGRPRICRRRRPICC